MIPLLDDGSLHEIAPEDLQLYLLASKWREAEVVNKCLGIWTHDDIARELFVPRDAEAVDYESQLNLIVHFLADLESRNPRHVLSDMKHTGADVIRLKIDTPKLARGTIPLTKAAEIINETRTMLTSAARAAIHPQSFFASRPSADVSDYLETTQLGQTEPGSFIFTVISPITFPRSTEPSKPPPLPFARRVTETLSKSLAALRGAAQFSERPLTTVFEDLVDEGISANLCEALYVISEQSFDKAVDIDFTWSTKSPVPDNRRRSNIVVPPMITSTLRSMSTHLKSVSPEPGFEVIGTVVKLSNQEATADFELALRASIEGRERLIALELTDNERETASTAWRTGRSVFTRGVLDRRFRPFRLLQPERFELIQLPD